MYSKKKKKIEVSTIIFNVIFTIILVLSSCGLCNAQNDDDSFESESQTGNAFVRFFKYGKHSILYNGFSCYTWALCWNHIIISKYDKCLHTRANAIISLFATRYECRYNIKSNIGVYVSGSLFDGVSFWDDVISSFNKTMKINDYKTFFSILNVHLGCSNTILHEKIFSWRMYAGIGITWNAIPFYNGQAYYIFQGEENYSKKTNKNTENYLGNYNKNGNFYELFALYFKEGKWKRNLKHFDIVIEVSAFDFIIKDHWRIALALKAGVGNLYNLYNVYNRYKVLPENEKKSFWEFLQEGKKVQQDILSKFVISIGYQF